MKAKGKSTCAEDLQDAINSGASLIVVPVSTMKLLVLTLRKIAQLHEDNWLARQFNIEPINLASNALNELDKTWEELLDIGT